MGIHLCCCFEGNLQKRDEEPDEAGDLDFQAKSYDADLLPREELNIIET